MSNRNPHHVCYDGGFPGAGEAGRRQANAIIDAIDRLTEAVRAVAGRRDPEPGRCPAMLKSGNVSIRCVRRLGHGDDCE